MNKKYYISTSQSNAPVDQLHIPRVIAKITICRALTIEVYDYMDWNPPTPEQIKNLKELLNIDVKLIGETDELHRV